MGPPPTRKSHVSCLMRKSHDSRENLMSFQYRVPPNEKISYLLSHEKISYLKRKSHVLSVLGPPANKKISCLLSHDKISCSKRKSHVFLVWGPPNEKISCLKRKSYVLSVFDPPPMRKSPVPCIERKS